MKITDRMENLLVDLKSYLQKWKGKKTMQNERKETTRLLLQK